jgi:cold shock CspA family protein
MLWARDRCFNALTEGLSRAHTAQERFLVQGKILRIVDKLSADKGPSRYGFLKDEKGVDRFFLPSHLAADDDLVWEDLRPGDLVSFEPATNPKGPRAEAIRLAKAVKA